MHSTALHRFENKSSSRPTTPPSALRLRSGQALAALVGDPGEALALASGALIRGAQLRLSRVDCLPSSADVSSSSKTPTQGQTKALNGAPASKPIVGSRLS